MPDEDLKQLLEAIRRENAAAHHDTRRHFDVAVEETRHNFDATDGSDALFKLTYSQIVPWQAMRYTILSTFVRRWSAPLKLLCHSIATTSAPRVSRCVLARL